MKTQGEGTMVLRKGRRVTTVTELVTGRYEVSLFGGRKTKKFSKKRSAIEFARVLARKRGVEVVMTDRGARNGSQHVWLLNASGLIRAISHRTLVMTSMEVH